MERDEERVARMREALTESQTDALICTRPSTVLLVSGYWPVVGTSISVITRDGYVVLIAPEDEAGLAAQSWADATHSFTTGSLTQMSTASESVRDTLIQVLTRLGLDSRARLGVETGEAFEPVSYAAMHVYGARVAELLAEAFPKNTIVPVEEMLTRLRATLTPKEIENVRATVRVAESAFLRGAKDVRCGLHETEVASLFSEGLNADDHGARGGGFVYCMSGPNSADAYRSYQRSSSRSIGSDDLVLIHCNSYLNGFWTDITRSFWVPPLDERLHKMYEAVFEAREAALAAVKPDVRAAEIDEAARSVLRDRGFSSEFKHGLGHGVGFAAINHNAPPRLHPASTDILRAGMVFNIEPAIYFPGACGLRHCEMVAVNEHGAELLTHFQLTIEELVFG